MNKNKQKSEVEKILTSLSNIVGEEDKKVWTERATAKYYKQEYELLLKREKAIRKQIAENEEKIKKTERKIPEIKKINEGLKSEILIGLDVRKHLIERRNDVVEDVEKWANKIKEKEESMNKFLEEERRKKEENNELYKQVLDKRNALKLKKIQLGILLKKAEGLKRQKKMRLEIDRQLFNSKIVTFVRTVKNYNRTIELDKEIETAKARLNELTMKLNKGPQVNLESYQKKGPNEFFPQPNLQLWDMEKTVLSKTVTKPNVRDTKHESVLLKKLQQRSNERKRRFLQIMDGSSNDMDISASSIASFKDEKPTTPAAITKDTNKKIKLIDNVDVTNIAVESQFAASKKADLGKVKRVSFGEPLSQGKETSMFNDGNVAQEESFNIPTEDNTTSKFFEKPANVGFIGDDTNQTVHYSFLSPEHPVAASSFENTAETTGQIDFFNSSPVFGDFGFNNTPKKPSGNMFSFF